VIAAITAGGWVEGAFAALIGSDVKALAPIGDRLLIDAAIESAKAAGAARIVVVGNATVRAHCGERVDEVVDAVADGRENLRRALFAARGEDLLLLTSDLPFITGDALDDFLSRRGDADIAMPLAEASEYEARFPGAADHATAIGNARVVNASVFFFRGDVVERVEPVSQQFFEARKNLTRMAALTGPVLLMKYLTGSLQIEDVERRAEGVFGVKARAVRNASPLLCYDVDTIDDYRYAVKHAASS
jgi:molybdopterin-guanine dinucleotide biosynthesis protein A